jgi:alkylhydroperoxidase family enzyme
MPRIKPLPRAEAAPSAAAVYDLVFGPDRDPAVSPGTATGTPGTFFTTWAHAPAILAHFQTYRPDPPILDPKLRAMAIVRTGYTQQSHFVFSQNCKAARSAGVDEAKIRAISFWTVSDIFTPEERAVLAFVDGHTLEGGRVHDEVFAALKQTFSEEQVLALAFTVSFFAMHARSSRALKLEYDDIADRIVEIPAPAQPGVQDWLDPKWAEAKEA